MFHNLYYSLFVFYFLIYNFFKKKNVGLKRLNISFNGFGREGSQGLALVLKKNRTLRELDLSYNRMVDEDIRVIAKGLTENDTLKTLVVITSLHFHSLYYIKLINKIFYDSMICALFICIICYTHACVKHVILFGCSFIFL